MAGILVVVVLAAPVATSGAGAPSPPAKATQGAGAAANTGPIRVEAQMAPGEVRATKFIGMSVYGPNNTPIGNVDDLVIDPQTGKIEAAILLVGGFVGIGDSRIAVPMERLTLSGPSHDRLNLDMSKDQLRRSPAYALGGGLRQGAPTAQPR